MDLKFIQIGAGPANILGDESFRSHIRACGNERSKYSDCGVHYSSGRRGIWCGKWGFSCGGKSAGVDRDAWDTVYIQFAGFVSDRRYSYQWISG